MTDDLTNKDRANRAAQATEKFADSPIDLLADFIHYCDANQLDFEEQLALARRTYEGDLKEEKVYQDALRLENAVVLDIEDPNATEKFVQAIKDRTPKGHA
jgi:uncharacterized protein (DUF952 family)